MRQFIFRSVLFSTCFLLYIIAGNACSTYKVTVNGITRYGMNYDTWFVNPRIWFETKGYGAAFTGANSMGNIVFLTRAVLLVIELTQATNASENPRNGINPANITSMYSYGVYCGKRIRRTMA